VTLRPDSLAEERVAILRQQPGTGDREELQLLEDYLRWKNSAAWKRSESAAAKIRLSRLEGIGDQVRGGG
jgi:hypothetical protein